MWILVVEVLYDKVFLIKVFPRQQDTGSCTFPTLSNTHRPRSPNPKIKSDNSSDILHKVGGSRRCRQPSNQVRWPIVSTWLSWSGRPGGRRSAAQNWPLLRQLLSVPVDFRRKRKTVTKPPRGKDHSFAAGNRHASITGTDGADRNLECGKCFNNSTGLFIHE